jgi:CubicO group peptidase (beta-lactamase class C family)
MAGVNLERPVRDAVGNTVPGIVAVVVGAEGVRARCACGVANAVSREPMRIDDAFPWFSMTKIATATTAVRLVERGVLELDAPLAPRVPAMRLLTPARWAAEITLRHLLQHSAGFANPIPITWIHPADQSGLDLDALLERLLAKRVAGSLVLLMGGWRLPHADPRRRAQRGSPDGRRESDHACAHQSRRVIVPSVAAGRCAGCDARSSMTMRSSLV